MDFGELKEKYGGSADNTKDDTNRLMLVCAAVAIVAGVAFYFTYFQGASTNANYNAVVAELSALSLDQATADALTRADCKTLDKGGDMWIAKDCTDQLYFKIYIAENGGYSVAYCYDEGTPQETFMHVKDYVGLGCVGASTDYSLIRETAVTKTYNICGNRIIFIDECLAGWGSL